MLEHVLFSESITNNYVIRLLLASFLGALIGLERDIHGRAAGLRTNLLVSLGSAVFMVISEAIAVSYSKNIGDVLLRSDPGRIAANIITGIGFLGAGTIIKSGLSVRGLTTAACLWLAAGIGMGAGAGFYELSILTTVIGLFSLIFLNRFERVYAKDTFRILDIVTSNSTELSEITKIVKRKSLEIAYMDTERNYNENKTTARFTIRISQKGSQDKLSHDILNDLERSGIQIDSIKWRHQ